MSREKTTRFPFQYMNFPSEEGVAMPFIKQERMRWIGGL